MKKLCLIVAMMVALGLAVGLYAESASAFFGGGSPFGGLKAGKFGKFGGGGAAVYYPGCGPYGCYYPCYAPYGCYYGPPPKKRAKPKAKKK